MSKEQTDESGALGRLAGWRGLDGRGKKRLEAGAS